MTVKNNSRNLLVLLLMVSALFLTVGCSEGQTEVDAAPEQFFAEEMSYQSEENDRVDPFEQLELETGYKFIDNVCLEHDDWRTIQFQKELVGKDFLLFEYFDVFEAASKLYLSAEDTISSNLFLVRISEAQYEEILQIEEEGNEAAIAFKVEDVIPMLTTFVPVHEFGWSIDDETGVEFIHEDSIETYVETMSGYRTINGTCLKVYALAYGD